MTSGFGGTIARQWRVRLAAARAAAGLLLGGPRSGGETGLAALACDLAGIGGVAHMTPEALARRMPAEPSLLLLDVRTEAEYRASHLAGAVRVEPSARAPNLGPADIAGRTVVVYCAVGVRSTLLALRLGPELRRLGATDIANLAGGIFAWHADGRPLVDAAGTARDVHPYNRLWGRMRHRPA